MTAGAGIRRAMAPSMREFLRGLWFDRKDARLTAERVAKFAAADVLVVSFTKSGRTWLRVLLSNLFSRRFALSDKELLDGDNLHRQAPGVPKVYFAPDTKFPYPEMGPAKVFASSRQKVVFLVRDPRDVAVSFYFHVKHRAGARELRRKRIPEAARSLAIDSFVLDPHFGTARAIAYLNRWAAERAALPQSHVLYYEELVADTVGAFTAVLDFIGQPADPSLVAEVVDFASFQSLQQKEREGFFDSDRLGQTRAGDAETGKVRQGRVGGYRDQLRPDTVLALDRLVRETLDPVYGYA
jgi:Sulfotransferase domain